MLASALLRCWTSSTRTASATQQSSPAHCPHRTAELPTLHEGEELCTHGPCRSAFRGTKQRIATRRSALGPPAQAAAAGSSEHSKSQTLLKRHLEPRAATHFQTAQCWGNATLRKTTAIKVTKTTTTTEPRTNSAPRRPVRCRRTPRSNPPATAPNPIARDRAMLPYHPTPEHGTFCLSAQNA